MKKMEYKKDYKRRHMAKGGTPYNAKGSPALKEAESEKDDFKRGGKTYKRGGKVHGKMAKYRADRPKRMAKGGNAGHSPFSHASKLEGRPSGNYGGKPSTKEDD